MTTKRLGRRSTENSPGETKCVQTEVSETTRRLIGPRFLHARNVAESRRERLAEKDVGGGTFGKRKTPTLLAFFIEP
ncbi:hypothetical protein F2P81_019406 [Scophthalmus maximus]|uniref:Uncharacterized protein n=1 Tax=Scophthalmus maximus TaxID=52904 RepID=A0A6A4S702_SCOMX|nr:hypothetical protein F2P81_019406 [Scophthalmus maximus]